MHRVVCCYPDGEALVAAAAWRAGRLLIFSFPRSNLVDERSATRVANVYLVRFRSIGVQVVRSSAGPTG